ncbi:MAG: hypothetical protein HY744_30010 [Deltaproteobacteria bacterium]|nr:hypothetical protein [Deltaproteobacteria bacterium]
MTVRDSLPSMVRLSVGASWLVAVGLLGCGDGGAGAPPGAPGGGAAAGAGPGGGGGAAGGGELGGGGEGGLGAGGAGQGGEGGGETCPQIMTCVHELPFHDERDTSKEGTDLIDVYDCKPGADESGPEIFYRVDVAAPGTLSATITDGEDVDIDVHILTSIKDGECLARDDVTATAPVEPPYVYVVADTYVSKGKPLAGPFAIDMALAAK